MSTKKKSNHGKAPTERKPLKQGEARHTVVASKRGDYVRVTVEYMTLARDVPAQRLGEQIVNAMYSGARMTDLRTLAAQDPGSIVEGELLASDGTFVVQAWIPREDELLVLKARPATLEDLATLERYAEDPSETDARKAEARRLIAERDANTVVDSGPALLT